MLADPLDDTLDIVSSTEKVDPGSQILAELFDGFVGPTASASYSVRTNPVKQPYLRDLGRTGISADLLDRGFCAMI